METVITVIGVLVVLGLIYFIIRGGIQTFRRNWILAILSILFLGPVWVIWAIVENFMSGPTKEPA